MGCRNVTLEQILALQTQTAFHVRTAMLWLWHTQSYVNPTLTPMISWEQPLQPYLPPGSLVPADTQNISCHSPAARGSTSLRSWRLCTEHRLVLFRPQVQPLLPGERMTQFQELQEPGKYWGPQGYRTGSPSLCNLVIARQAAAATGGFVEIKCQPGQSPPRHPESAVPPAWGKADANNLQQKHKAHCSSRPSLGKGHH